MKILVCVRQGLDGEISPFDACAYEAALRIPDADVTLLSMGPASARDFLQRLTRLGAGKAVLLSDPGFAGADTLATAYTLSLAVKRLQPELVLCGRQTLIGDTGQVGPMLSVYAGLHLITEALSMDVEEAQVTCQTRRQGIKRAPLPALVTVERIHTLRLPSLFSKPGTVEVWNAGALGAELSRCGLSGSPTRVLETYPNQSGKRKCTFIPASRLRDVVREAAGRRGAIPQSARTSPSELKPVWCIGAAPLEFARSVSSDITVLEPGSADEIAACIRQNPPSAVLWGSDAQSKELAAQTAALLNLGLCADCTALETDGSQLLMYRPALSGSIFAKIISKTRPAMATVRTVQAGAEIVVAAGFGAAESLDVVKAFANEIGGELAASRKAVDNGLLPYPCQVGLTGKTVSPAVYIAVGISGAVHHLVGMEHAGTVIAINPDPNAAIFEYADYGILADARILASV